MQRQLAIRILLAAILCLGLTGCAPALIGAGATGGYKVVTDERSAGDMVDDSVISSRVWKAFAAEPGINQYKIDVDTVEGRVTLTGLVSVPEEARLAETTAAKVEGVRAVRNNLQVGDKTIGRSINDKILVTKIKSKLIAAPGVRSLNIDVDAVLGVVTLTGIVSSPTQRATILDSARGTSGVANVVDNMTLRAD